jgi:excisionase family DNA binding protein
MEEQILTVQETAAYLKVDADTIRRWLRGGQLPGRKFGRSWRIRKSDVDKLFNGRQNGQK